MSISILSAQNGPKTSQAQTEGLTCCVFNEEIHKQIQQYSAYVASSKLPMLGDELIQPLIGILMMGI